MSANFDMQQIPVIGIEPDARSRFIMRTYWHLFVAILGFAVMISFCSVQV